MDGLALRRGVTVEAVRPLKSFRDRHILIGIWHTTD
jgi:hypothetical protein